MKSIFSSTAFITLILFMNSCGSSRVHLEPKTATVESTNVFRMTMEWLRAKSDHMDMSVNLTNDSKGLETVWADDFVCSAGGQFGRVTMTSYEIDPIIFKRDESKNIQFHCSFGSHIHGPYKFGITKVSSGANKNDKAAGKIIGHNLFIEQIGAK